MASLTSAAPPAAGPATELLALDRLLAELRGRAANGAGNDDRALLEQAAVALEREAAARHSAEQRLHAREQQMEHLGQLAEMGSWEYDMETNRITWSREQLRIHGLPLDQPERTEAEFLSLVHPDDRQRIVDVMTRLVETGETFFVEYRIVRPDGQVRLLQAPGRMVPGPTGRLTRMIGTSLDVTERRAVELALRASEESYRAIFDSSNDAIYVHDLETGAVLDANRRACENSGATLEQLREDGFAYIANGPPPFTRDQAVAHMERAMAGELVRFEWMSVQPETGEEMWVEVSLQRVTIGNGNGRVLALVRDIRDRKVAEEELRRREESYRVIFQCAADGMFLHDAADGALLDANDAACELLGYSVEELKVTGCMLAGDMGYTAERAMPYVQAALAGEPQRFEWLNRHRDGHLVWTETTLHRVTIRGEARILAVARGINDRRAAEEALRASEASYRTIFRHASDGMWLHDIDTGDILDVNEAACDLFGRSVEEQQALGVGLLSAGRAPYTLADAMRYVQGAVAGEPQRFEWLGPHKDGHDVWLEMRLSRVTINGVDRVLATGRDIRDRKAAEAALWQANERLEQRVAERTAELRAREAQLRETQRLARLGSWQWDVATGVVRWDEAYCAALGISPDVAPHDLASYLALVHPGDRDRARELVERAMATGEPYAYDYRVLLPDGRLRHMQGRGHVVLGPDGVPTGMVGTAQDVTERREAELALADREEHFRRIIENTSDFVMIVDDTAAITYVGPSATRMLGYPTEELLGQRPAHLVHPDDVPRVMQDFEWIATHPGEPYTSTFRIRHRDGTYRVFENLGRTMSEHSMADGVVAFGRDVTERTHAEAALARAKEEAERANLAKSEFLSRMSHELRTPMNSILGFGQLLARANLAPQHAKGVQHIVKAGRHLLNLINEVLEIARIESGRENLSLEPVALGPVLREALGLVRPLAQQHAVEVRDGDGGDGSSGTAPWPDAAFVRADRQRLVQVLLNLLSNAIKYNRPGGHVALACAPAGGRWSVRIEDGGRGIPADRVDQLFTPFARLGAEQTEVEGTGLGLALSQRLCEAMGGSLQLESSGPGGSVFRIDLDGADDPVRALEETGAHAVPTVPHREATLLYVEDNLANLSLVETILLSRPGWRTIPALQGQLGVELAREHLPDVVLLDLHLPDISGEEVLRRLRADSRTAGIPVIIVSADATPSSLERLCLAGADAYITKPLDVDEFLRAIERFLPGPVLGERA